MANDLKRLRKFATRHGWSVELRKAHYLFRDPQGRAVATAAATAGEYRSLKNTIGHLRAAGLPVPHKGGHTPRERNQ